MINNLLLSELLNLITSSAIACPSSPQSCQKRRIISTVLWLDILNYCTSTELTTLTFCPLKDDEAAIMVGPAKCKVETISI